MSLLNEMVNDLNKAKSCNGEGILLHTEYSWLRKNLPPIFKALGLGLLISFFLFLPVKLLYHKKAKEHNIQEKSLLKVQPEANKIGKPLNIETDKKKEVYSSKLLSTSTIRFVPKVAAVKKNMSKKSNNIEKKAYPLGQKEWLAYTYNDALIAIDREDYPLAVQILKKILTSQPRQAKVRETLAMLYFKLNENEMALKEIDAGLSLSKDSPPLIRLKAEFLNKEGQLNDAIALMESTRPEFRNYRQYYATLAALYEANGDMAKAEGLYKSLLTLSPDEGQYWLGYAIALEASQNVHQAVHAYENAMLAPTANGSVKLYAGERLALLQGGA